MAVGEAVTKKRKSKVAPWTQALERVPWWALILILIGVYISYSILNSETYHDTFLFLSEGVKTTILLTVVSFAIALVVGLITGFGRISDNIIVYNIATFYVEVVRGIPLLIQLLYVAFVVVPLAVQGLNAAGSFLVNLGPAGFLAFVGEPLANVNIQNVNMLYRAIFGLALGYGAYEAEVFRAGIESIERGQMEAARSLGMSYWQAMRYVILPQAIRRVLPPLGNDFVAMLKDSSLVSALAVRELTQLAKLNRARTFRSFETYNTAVFLYLAMTLVLSIGVKVLERRMSGGK
ncbi:MAG: Glutamine transport system permease protein GlnP [Anaerolineales bacterium]|nr:Glutamine transport system permease protein GlnP [Anaerolineales bacterium]